MRIFEIDEERNLKVSEHTMLVPELAALVKHYEDPMPALKYIYLMTAPDSPYGNLPKEEKESSILEDVGGEFSLDDEVLAAAIEKLAKLFVTPTMRFYKSVVESLDRMSEYLDTATIEGGRDGNLGEIDRIQSNAGKKMESVKKLEQIVAEEMKVTLRGKAKMGMY